MMNSKKHIEFGVRKYEKTVAGLWMPVAGHKSCLVNLYWIGSKRIGVQNT